MALVLRLGLAGPQVLGHRVPRQPQIPRNRPDALPSRLLPSHPGNRLHSQHPLNAPDLAIGGDVSLIRRWPTSARRSPPQVADFCTPLHILVYVLPPVPRCSDWASSSLISPSRISLPRNCSRVGLHIDLFEACAAFTRVAARTLAPSPIRDQLHRRLQPFRHLHDCSGCFRLERSPGGTCTHLESAAFSRRTQEAVVAGRFGERVKSTRSRRSWSVPVRMRCANCGPCLLLTTKPPPQATLSMGCAADRRWDPSPINTSLRRGQYYEPLDVLGHYDWSASATNEPAENRFGGTHGASGISLVKSTPSS